MLSTLAVSLPELTVQAAIVLGISLVVLLFVSWRRPRTVTRDGSPRRSSDVPIMMARIEPPVYRRPNPIRRLISLALGGAMGVLLGTLVAIMVSIVAAIIVIQLSSLLR